MLLTFLKRLSVSFLVILNFALAHAYGQSDNSLLPSLPLSNDYPVTFVRMESPSTSLTPNYFDIIRQSSKGHILHFMQFPISVYIADYNDKGYLKSAFDAFKNWENESNGIVNFNFVSDPNLARIKVIWSRLGTTTNNSNCALGAHTITKFYQNDTNQSGWFVVNNLPLKSSNASQKYTVPPQIIEVNLDLISSKPSNIRLLVLKNILTHEIGHALGLLGHSLCLSDIMYEVTDEYSHISKRDIETLKVLYNTPCDIPL